MAEGYGSRLRDVDGHEYVDYLLGLGPMILGHRHPTVTQAVTSAISELGTCFGLPYELEIEAARKVTEAVPGIEHGPVLQLGQRGRRNGRPSRPRAYRPQADHSLRGHYHGWQDTVYWSNHVDPQLAGPARIRRGLSPPAPACRPSLRTRSSC